MAGALEVINNDPNVRSIFINIFGGITKGEEVANGIVAALGRVDIDVADRDPPRRHQRRRGPRDPRAAPVRQAADRSRPCSKPPQAVVELRREGERNDEHLRRREHQGRLPGPHRLAGPLLRPAATATTAPRSSPAPTPRRPAPTSTASRSSPSVADAVEATGATASCIFIPAPGVKDAVHGGRRGRRRVHRRASPRACPPRTRRGSSTSSSATSRTCSCSARTAPASSAPASATSASPPARSPSAGRRRSAS